MDSLEEILNNLNQDYNWKEYIQSNFERENSLFLYVCVKTFEIQTEQYTYRYPRKIIFDTTPLNFDSKVDKKTKININNKEVIVAEKINNIRLKPIIRKGIFSGDFSDIIKDIVGDNINEKYRFSKDLLSYRESPLYNIDSSIDWSSYIIILEDNNYSHISYEVSEKINIEKIASDFGIHYPYRNEISKYTIVVFPFKYIKILENKIHRHDNKQSLYIVLEYNQSNFIYNSQLNIEINCVIRNRKNEIIFENVLQIKYTNTKYQSFEINPESTDEIGHSSIHVKINGIEVDKMSGYYIKDIKFISNVGNNE